MALNLRKAHVYEKVGKRQELQLVAEHHIVRVRAGENGPLFVQDGQVYSEGGQVIIPIPDWFWTEYKKTSKEARQACGLMLPEDKKVDTSVEVIATPEKSVEQKECPECSKLVSKKAFGLHIARHRKAEARI